jgi:site-specific DNA recombinase
MEIALYVRVSTTRQHHTQTIEQQLTRLRAAVAMHPDWHLAEEHIYRDDGYSGAKLKRPGLDRLRDRAAFGAFERVLLTAPDRLARNYVHQILLIDEFTQRGCQVEFLDRPMSADPHDQLLLHIRGAVAEYERTLIAERMRRGRQAKLRSGQLLPWTKAPYGYLLDPKRPRDPSRVRPDAVKAAVVAQIFGWYTDESLTVSLYWVAKRLSDAQIPTPSGCARWNVASVRGILRNPAYAGAAYSGRTYSAPARQRKSPLQPLGPGASERPAPPEEWIAVPVPALITEETFAAAQSRLDRNTRFARRNNTAHDYLLRGLVSCGQCQLACTGRATPAGYTYYTCRGRTDTLRAAAPHRCTARYAPAPALDTLVWQDLCQVLTEPALITHELARARGGEWLPHVLQARRQTLRKALAEVERQQARLLEVYLAAIIGREEFDRKHQEVTQTQHGLAQQLHHLDLQAQQQVDVAALAQGIEAFCHRIRPTLDHLTFAQRRQLVTLLIDRVVVSDGQVEIRYVVPTGPKGETVPFCHLRLDYFKVFSRPVELFL